MVDEKHLWTLDSILGTVFGHHVDQEDNDRKRDLWLTEHGYSVLRFWNNEIFENPESVLEVIRDKLLDR